MNNVSQDSNSSEIRKILHVDMDAFYVEVELLDRPELRGLPVIVGGKSSRGVVTTCSYEARKFGVHSAMPSVQAQRLCPQAVWINGNHSQYEKYSRAFVKILNRYSPEVAKLSIDEARVDLTGSERLFGNASDIAHRILNEIKDELGLPASAGLANSGTAAKIASELAKPAGLAVILPGYEQPFLAPLKVERIPGIGKKSLPRFKRAGIHTIGDIARRSPEEMTRVCGRWSSHLMNIAKGSTRKSIRQDPAAPSRSNERTFMKDITDPDLIRQEIRRLVENLGFRLRRSGFKTRTIGVKIRDSRFKTITRSITLATPVNADNFIFETAIKLVFQNLPRNSGVRLLGVTAQNLSSRPRQKSLFESGPTRHENFYNTVDTIKQRFGRNAVHFAVPQKKRFQKMVYSMSRVNEEIPS